jgi:hypothetical protein
VKEYYISYLFNNGNGNAEISYHKKINTYEDIKKISKLLEEKGSITGVNIISIIPLKKK